MQLCCLARVFRALGLMLAAGLVCGCSAVDAPKAWGAVEIGRPEGGETHCHRVFMSLKHEVANAGVHDAETHAIPGFPYLRVNRFLAHLGERFEGRAYGPAFVAWVDRLQALNTEALQIEIANLSDNAIAELSKSLLGQAADRKTMNGDVRKCAAQLRVEQLARPAQRRLLVSAAKVPDNYDEGARALGAFPLASIPIEIGWDTWKRDNLATFQVAPSDLPSAGELVEYVPERPKGPPQTNAIGRILKRSRSNRLEIPEPEGEDLQRLLDAFAPIWQIDTAASYDRFGQPRWGDDGNSIAINVEQPTVFTHVGHTVLDGQILLQLTYAIWFPARPPQGSLDLLSGNLDAVFWRVTLAPDGQPLVYDSIHGCGCYHLVFPLPAIARDPDALHRDELREAPAIIEGAPVLKPTERIVLRIATGSHYLVGVHARTSRSGSDRRHGYRMVGDKALRSLPLPRSGRRSLYGEDGIVPGTERLERYLLWPSGVLSPGAMRQWGHHAVALTGRRHFDDADLLEHIVGRRSLQ